MWGRRRRWRVITRADENGVGGEPKPNLAERMELRRVGVHHERAVFQRLGHERREVGAEGVGLLGEIAGNEFHEQPVMNMVTVNVPPSQNPVCVVDVPPLQGTSAAPTPKPFGTMMWMRTNPGVPLSCRL